MHLHDVRDGKNRIKAFPWWVRNVTSLSLARAEISVLCPSLCAPQEHSAGGILWHHSPKPAWMNLHGNLLLPRENLGPGWAQHGAGYELSTVGGVQATNRGSAWEYDPLPLLPESPPGRAEAPPEPQQEQLLSIPLSRYFPCQATAGTPCAPCLPPLPLLPFLWILEKSLWQHRLNSPLPSLEDVSVVFQERALEPWAADMHVATDALCCLPKAHPVCAPTSG